MEIGQTCWQTAMTCKNLQNTFFTTGILSFKAHCRALLVISMHFCHYFVAAVSGYLPSNSFSRYCNENLKVFVQYMFVKICWNMRFLSRNVVHNQFKNLQWFIFQVWLWNFERFECDLRDIDGASQNIRRVNGFKGNRWRNSFSRYCNEILKVFFQYMFVKICWNMRCTYKNSVHNRF